MRSVGLVLLALSLVLGGFAVWGLRHVSGARAQPAPPAAVSQTMLVVAARPISVGEKLTPEAVRLQPWPSQALPPGGMRTLAEATSGAPIALSAIQPNEPILKSRISGPGARPTLSGVIQAGMRAATIRVDDVMGVAGFVLPGDFVDVLVTRPEGSSGPGGAIGQDLRTDVLFSGVRVLAVDQVASEGKNDPVVAKAATIELSPEQAQKLALARQVGTVSLVLRGTADPIGPGAARAVRVADLSLDNRRLAASSAPAPRRASVSKVHGPAMQIYRGGTAAMVAVRAE